MRNIIICGTARAGKTTLSRMIMKKYPIYQMLSGDSIRHAYNISFYEQENLTDDIVGEKEDYQRLLKNYYNTNLYENSDLRFILDLVDLAPKDSLTFANDNPIVIYLGYAGRTVEEVMENYKVYDTKDDWTYGLPDEKLRLLAQMFLDKSNYFKKECEKYNVKYVDTFYNREETLRELFVWIEKEMIKK